MKGPAKRQFRLRDGVVNKSSDGDVRGGPLLHDEQLQDGLLGRKSLSHVVVWKRGVFLVAHFKAKFKKCVSNDGGNE